ncbi:MAG: glycogen/starch synthase [Halanaerobiales bacterium]|nr:glycogen/starch synthase [Halanaerobiales bacterium]
MSDLKNEILSKDLMDTLKNSQKLIVHVAIENAPYSKRGGLGDVVGSLPIYLSNHQYTNLIFSPYYSILDGNPDLVHEEEIDFNGVSYCYQLYAIKKGYNFNLFVKIEEAFSFDEIYSNGLLPYTAEITLNYFVFSKVIVHFMNKYINICYIMTHDWHVGAIYLYLQPSKSKYKTFHIIHNYHYQGGLFEDIIPYLESEIQGYISSFFSKYGYCSLSALALEYTDQIITVSPSYAEELINQKAPHPGLQFIANKKNIVGILNGTYSNIWNPQNDEYLIKNYDVNSLHYKTPNKEYLINKFNLKITKTTPLVVMLCRLAMQKGIDLFIDMKIGSNFDIIQRMKGLLDMGIGLIICGTPQGGLDGPIDIQFKEIYNTYKDRFVYINNYTEEIAHQLLAGGDILIHPSRFEPCGLTQMYSLAYGTIPIVTPVGGLKDSITCFIDNPNEGFGFHMPSYGYEELSQVLQKAVSCYQDKKLWTELIIRAMSQNNDWTYRIQPYLELLEKDVIT